MRVVSSVKFEWLKPLLPRLHAEIDLKRLCNRSDLSFLQRNEPCPAVHSSNAKRVRSEEEIASEEAELEHKRQRLLQHKAELLEKQHRERDEKAAAAKARLLERRSQGLINQKLTLKYKR